MNVRAKAVLLAGLLVFSAVRTAHAAVATATATAAAYHIHAGDTLAVSVAEDPTFATTGKVLDDGTLGLPLIGRVALRGLPIDEAQQRLAYMLSEYVRNPQVTIDVVKVGIDSVLVLGNVKTPGKYALRAGSRFTDAIAAAGGLGPVDGPLPDARLGNPTGSVRYVSLQDVLRRGDMQSDLPVTNGDVIYVPSPIDIRVTVLGAVDRPGELALHYGDPITAAIALAGAGANAQADLSHVYLTRMLPNDVKHTYEINLYQALQGNNEKFDVPLQQGDIVYVPQEKKAGGVLWGSLLILRRILLGY